MRGVKEESATKSTQAAAVAHNIRFERRVGTSSRDSNIQSRLNGIAEADAKARRPRSIFGSDSLVDRYSEIEPIHPMMVSMERAKSRFTRALGSRARTTKPRPKRTAQRRMVPRD
jgi:hypothetical protein